jgi:hypothetical protein
VRAREEVDALNGPAEKPASCGATAVTKPELGMEVAGVDDSKDAVVARRHGFLEVGCVEPVRDGDDVLVLELARPPPKCS